MMKKIICLLLVLSCLVMCFASCDERASGTDDGGDRGADGSWDNVDFGGEKLYICVSANQDKEVTFPACDIYTKGPDTTTTEEVQKKVLTRNKKVESLLNLEVVYSETDLTYDLVLGDIEKRVLGADEDAPDIYNNDMYGLARAMVRGYLWNVSNPGLDADGNEVKNYFDFTYDGWNYDFMKGCTFDQNKMYLLAGDYFIDMVRMAWVLYANVDMFNENAASLGFGTINDFYEYVEAGIWDYDDLATISSRIWKDDGANRDVTDKEDSRVGLAINHVSDWIFLSSSGITTYYQDAKGKPQVMTDVETYTALSNAIRKIMAGEGGSASVMVTGDGIYYQSLVISSTELFFNGNVLFAISVLGELESAAMRGVDFQKGLVPIPKWDEQRQDAYHTMVHDQTEIGAILTNASSFGKASAYMQAANEESEDVLHEYYEKGLKFKYGEDKGIRSMIDLVYDTIDSPFGMQISGLGGTSSSGPLVGMYSAMTDGKVASVFASEVSAYKANLAKRLEEFAKLE